MKSYDVKLWSSLGFFSTALAFSRCCARGFVLVLLSLRVSLPLPLPDDIEVMHRLVRLAITYEILDTSMKNLIAKLMIIYERNEQVHVMATTST
jgi:hypothetical protein